MTETASRSDTRARIVDAAARLLHQDGPAAVTTRGVAEHAGVQAPTIYRLFGDKDGLLQAVAEHVLATYVSSKAAMVASASADGIDPLDDLRAGWGIQIDFGLANPAIFALLGDPGRSRHSPAAQAGRRILASRVHRIAATGRLRVSEERAVDLIHAAGTGAVLTLLSLPSADRDLSLADELYEAVLRQILTDTPVRDGGELVATAVAFRAVAPRFDMLSDAERRLLSEWLGRIIDALSTA